MDGSSLRTGHHPTHPNVLNRGSNKDKRLLAFLTTGINPLDFSLGSILQDKAWIYCNMEDCNPNVQEAWPITPQEEEHAAVNADPTGLW